MTSGLGSSSINTDPVSGSDLLHKGKFHNASGKKRLKLTRLPTAIWRYFTKKSSRAFPSADIPITPLSLETMEKLDGTLVVKLGHSSLLLRLDGNFWLIDPVFSQRASPVQWAGPKRFHQTPIELDALGELEGVILSHDHYDHLDKLTIKKLHSRVKHFYTPLKLGKQLQQWGVTPDKITELDWWQSATRGDIKLIATPAQHFSGRGLLNGNETLWVSWVIITNTERLFFSGDSGYFEGFKTIGERYGPFDMTFIETGAYNSDWANVHMFPEESFQAYLDLQGKWMVPVHNGTFDLALHAWYEPMERVMAAGEQYQQKILTPKFGDIIQVGKPEPTEHWWKTVEPDAG